MFVGRHAMKKARPMSCFAAAQHPGHAITNVPGRVILSGSEASGACHYIKELLFGIGKAKMLRYGNKGTS